MAPRVKVMEQVLLTVPEAAALLRINPSLVRQLIQRGEIPHMRVGRFMRVPREQLLDVLAQRTQGAG